MREIFDIMDVRTNDYVLEIGEKNDRFIDDNRFVGCKPNTDQIARKIFETDKKFNKVYIHDMEEHAIDLEEFNTLMPRNTMVFVENREANRSDYDRFESTFLNINVEEFWLVNNRGVIYIV